MLCMPGPFPRPLFKIAERVYESPDSLFRAGGSADRGKYLSGTLHAGADARVVFKSQGSRISISPGPGLQSGSVYLISSVGQPQCRFAKRSGCFSDRRKATE